MKHLFLVFLFLLFTVHYSLFTVQCLAYVNIIGNPADADNAVAHNLNQMIVFAGDPDNPQAIIDVCNKAQVCVIRGHSHWTGTGQLMFGSPEEAAARWNTALKTIAAGVSKTIYFEPWNEPTSVNPECNNQNLDKCITIINRFINALHLPPGVILTTPSIDPHNQENSAAKMIQLLGNLNRFGAISFHTYSPETAKDYIKFLKSLGLPNSPVVITESGIVKNGRVVYEDGPLCEEMYCGAGVINFWKQHQSGEYPIVGWSLFSSGPDQVSWNLWEHQCVIDALKGNCHCESCVEEKKDVASLIRSFFTRQTSSPHRSDAKSGIGLSAGPSTPNNGPTFLNNLLSLFGIHGKFPTSQGHYAPSDENGSYPGEDPYTSYYYAKKAIDLENQGTIAEICLPDRGAIHKFQFFADQHPQELQEELLNMTTNNDLVALSPALQFIRDWFTGSAFDDSEEYIDVERDGNDKLTKRGITDRKAGYYTKYLPGEKMGNIQHELIINQLYLAADPENLSSPQSKGGFPIFDKPMERTCSGGGILTEDKFKDTLSDGRINRTSAEGCTEIPIEVKTSTFACCNPNFFQSRPDLHLNYETACGVIPKDWMCKYDQSGNILEPNIAGDLLYTSYPQFKRTADTLHSNADLPLYLEDCYEVSEIWAKTHMEIFRGFFIDLSPQERYQVFPVASSDNPNPRNTFITKAEDVYWSCQLTKIYLPKTAGVLDTCVKMFSTYLPGELYQELTEGEPPARKTFPCETGTLPVANGPATNKGTEEMSSLGNILTEPRWSYFITKNIVETDDCPTGSSGQNYEETVIDPKTGKEVTITRDVPARCTKEAKVKSHARLYVPFYDKFILCAKGFKSLLAIETAETLDVELTKNNNNKLDPDNLLSKSAKTGRGWNAGLDSPGDVVDHWRDNPSSVRGETFINDGDLILPGGSLEINGVLSGKQYFPGEWESQQ